MSKNATRHGTGMGYKATSTGYSHAVHLAVLAAKAEQEREAKVDLAVAHLDAMFTNYYRKGLGVAWVDGVSYRDAGERGSFERGLLKGQCPVITEHRKAGRVVITQVNSKLRLLRIVD